MEDLLKQDGTTTAAAATTDSESNGKTEGKKESEPLKEAARPREVGPVKDDAKKGGGKPAEANVAPASAAAPKKGTWASILR